MFCDINGVKLEINRKKLENSTTIQLLNKTYIIYKSNKSKEILKIHRTQWKFKIKIYGRHQKHCQGKFIAIQYEVSNQ